VDYPPGAGQLKGDLDWIVMKCLEKDRPRRYETANGLAADLKRHLNNEPLVARPAGGIYRARKPVQRNKVAFAGTAVRRRSRVDLRHRQQAPIDQGYGHYG
jgi:hypothetical protein